MNFIRPIALALLMRPLLALVAWVRRNPAKALVFLVLTLFGWGVGQSLIFVGALLERYGVISKDGPNPIYKSVEWLVGHRWQSFLFSLVLVPVVPVFGAGLSFWLLVSAVKEASLLTLGDE